MFLGISSSGRAEEASSTREGSCCVIVIAEVARRTSRAVCHAGIGVKSSKGANQRDGGTKRAVIASRANRTDGSAVGTCLIAGASMRGSTNAIEAGVTLARRCREVGGSTIKARRARNAFGGCCMTSGIDKGASRT